MAEPFCGSSDEACMRLFVDFEPLSPLHRCPQPTLQGIRLATRMHLAVTAVGNEHDSFGDKAGGSLCRCKFNHARQDLSVCNERPQHSLAICTFNSSDLLRTPSGVFQRVPLIMRIFPTWSYTAFVLKFTPTHEHTESSITSSATAVLAFCMATHAGINGGDGLT